MVKRIPDKKLKTLDNEVTFSLNVADMGLLNTDHTRVPLWEVCEKLNGANTQMVSTIVQSHQGKHPAHKEASNKCRSFDLSLVRWIRARRLDSLGHILRMGIDRKLMK